MIEYIRGQLAELQPAMAVIDCGGVGYGVSISLETFSAIEGKKEVKLYISESIREDAYQLFGFATRAERELFLQLTSVSGVGAGTARMILSALSPAELCDVIGGSNVKMLKAVKGIGSKTAERIIVDLKDKILSVQGSLPTRAGSGDGAAVASSPVAQEAEAALTMLGFSPAPSHKVVVEILQEQPALPVEQVIKIALKRL